MEQLARHYRSALERYPEDRIVGLFVQGSTNYGLDTEFSNLDTKLIVTPTFEEIAFAKQPVSTTTMGERLDKLCQEFHCGYEPLKREMEKLGVKINTHAGPKKLSKRIAAIDPETKDIVAIYESISAAARAICPPGYNAKAIGNHISRYKDMPSISHGFYWKTKNTLSNIDEL